MRKFPDEPAKRAFFCECTAAAFAAAGIASIEFLWPGPPPRAGQFFLVKPRRTGVFLGRPISVSGWKPGQTADGGTVRFLVARQGQGSRELADLKPGEEAELIGPLGNYWAAAEIFAGSPESLPPIALIGGGVGIAPLLAFAGELTDSAQGSVSPKRVLFDFYAGFRSAPFGLETLNPPNARSLVIATEDGCEGAKGRVTEFFAPSGYGGVFACGPEPMLRAIRDACAASTVPCFISVERHMACGVGACLGCTVKTTGGNQRCCVEGPIFDAGEVCFDA
ncbi:MAG: dihydroorotate dehydrogenase electron transfer subunit [Treponema sp.]|nr:dihydroorotate dehydrogenase electron transfer subunit [Treponema sp.]